MTDRSRSVQRGAFGFAVLTSLGITTIALAQAPKLPPAPPAPPSAASSLPVIVPKTPPEQQVDAKLASALASRPGGLRSDDVARRAELSSPEVLAKQRAVEGAAAKVDQAYVNFVPRVSMLARYVRLSPITPLSLGNIVGAQAGTSVIYAQCPPAVDGQPIHCYVNNAQAVPFSFPVILNQYTIQGSLAIPISDYLLRIPQNYASTLSNESAARLQEKATRAKVQRDARVTYYNWVRAKGGVVVADQALATVKAHLDDVKNYVAAGTASRADLLRVESQVASTELVVERSKNLTELVQEQLRVIMHDKPDATYEIGEDVWAAAPSVGALSFQDLTREALDHRLELKSIDESVDGLRKTRKVLVAGYYPRLDGIADAIYANPNSRVFPQQEKWKMTWDVGVQLSWTINDTFSTKGTTAEIDAKLLEIDAQREQLRDGIRMEVMATLNAVREADVAVGTTSRQLAAAEEGYRVRQALYRAGRATNVELIDAETELMRSRFDALNARIDAKVARVNLDHALGRDIQALAGARVKPAQ